jgi:valyl-tRNA synthetase
MYYAKQENKLSIHISDWPEYDKKLSNEKLEKDSESFLTVIAQVRQFKSKNGKSLKEPVKVEIPIELEKTLEPFLEDLKATTNALDIKFEKSLKETKTSF